PSPAQAKFLTPAIRRRSRNISPEQARFTTRIRSRSCCLFDCSSVTQLLIDCRGSRVSCFVTETQAARLPLQNPATDVISLQFLCFPTRDANTVPYSAPPSCREQ